MDSPTDNSSQEQPRSLNQNDDAGLPEDTQAVKSKGKVKRKSSRVTMNVVADKAGVSRMTVSRALRDDPSISATTRHLIKRIANELGYRPDPLISQFMSRVRISNQVGAETIAWLTTWPTKGGWRKYLGLHAFYDGAKHHAISLGYKLEEFWLMAPGMTGQRMTDILRARGIRGILVAPLFEIRQQLYIDWQYFAVATCGGYTMLNPRMHRACCNYMHSVMVAYAAFQRLGYERVGIAYSEEIHNRLEGQWLAQTLLEQSKLPESCCIPSLIMPRWENGENRFIDWFQRYQPDAILSLEQVPGWLAANGVDIPGDCAFATIDIPLKGAAHVDEQHHQVGEAGINLIIEQLNMNRFGPPVSPRTMQVECKWVDGPTAPPKVRTKNQIRAHT